ncbi:MAG: hypothetical protein H7840_17575 [Alphaproteobacteria bacterium]
MKIDLPFVYLDQVYHIGKLTINSGMVEPRDIEKNWDFEFGLLSVSLEPEKWRQNWAGPDAQIFELRPPCGPFRFIDADQALIQQADEIRRCAINRCLLATNGNILLGTKLLYDKLNLNYPSIINLEKRSNDEQLIQASLAVLARSDQTIHGLWWSDLLSGTMRSARGGIYQSLLSTMNVNMVQQPVMIVSNSAVAESSTILDGC